MYKACNYSHSPPTRDFELCYACVHGDSVLHVLVQAPRRRVLHGTTLLAPETVVELPSANFQVIVPNTDATGACGSML
jgi:hypothetical protein